MNKSSILPTYQDPNAKERRRTSALHGYSVRATTDTESHDRRVRLARIAGITFLLLLWMMSRFSGAEDNMTVYNDSAPVATPEEGWQVVHGSEEQDNSFVEEPVDNEVTIEYPSEVTKVSVDEVTIEDSGEIANEDFPEPTIVDVGDFVHYDETAPEENEITVEYPGDFTSDDEPTVANNVHDDEVVPEEGDAVVTAEGAMSEEEETSPSDGLLEDTASVIEIPEDRLEFDESSPDSGDGVITDEELMEGEVTVDDVEVFDEMTDAVDETTDFDKVEDGELVDDGNEIFNEVYTVVHESATAVDPDDGMMQDDEDVAPEDYVVRTPEQIEIEETIAASPVVIFSKTYCPFSQRAKNILAQFDLSPPPVVVEVDLRPDSSKMKEALTALDSRTAFPHIFIGGKPIVNDMEHLSELYESGELRRSLVDAGALEM